MKPLEGSKVRGYDSDDADLKWIREEESGCLIV